MYYRSVQKVLSCGGAAGMWLYLTRCFDCAAWHCFRWLRFFRVAESCSWALPTPEARHRRWAHLDVSVTGATECCDRFNGSALTIDW